MEYKLPIDGRDVYQAIIIRIQQTIYGSIMVSVGVTKGQE